MFPSPNALRWTTFITTGVVLFCGVAGFLVLWHGIATKPPDSAPPEGDPPTTGVRRLPPPAGMPAATSAGMKVLLANYLGAAAGADEADARLALVAQGTDALPFLLDALAGEATGPSAWDEPARSRFGRIDGALVAVRTALAPRDSPPPVPAAPDAAWARERSASWFAWYDARPK